MKSKRKFMKKLVPSLILATVAALMLSLAACSAEPDENAAEPATPVPTEVRSSTPTDI